MKPKTKLQILVSALSSKLPSITEKQSIWAFDACFKHYAYRNKTSTVCMECGCSFQTIADRCDCPSCNKRVEVLTTQKRVDMAYGSTCFITTCDKFQVTRFIEIMQYYRKGEAVKYEFHETMQHWISEDGKYTVMANLPSQGYYSKTMFSWYNNLEIRGFRDYHNVQEKIIYPKYKCIDKIKRNGFKNDFHSVIPLVMFTALLTNNKLETCLKLNHIEFFKFFCDRNVDTINKFWPSIKICIRNNYHPQDVSIWKDYIELLTYFNKDVMNAKYVCPANLNKEHDKLVAKKSEVLRLERLEEDKVKALAQQDKFIKLKKKFFGLEFSDELIQVKVLNSIVDYIYEGDALHHCVFTNDYYNKPNSLVLSARIEGKPIETIEVSLKNYKVLQSRGMHNLNSDYHDRIIGLVESNSILIKQRSKQSIAI